MPRASKRWFRGCLRTSGSGRSRGWRCSRGPAAKCRSASYSFRLQAELGGSMGWVVWIAASLVLLGAIVTLVGYRLPQAHSVSRTVRLPLAPDAVYALLIDVDKYP